MDHLQEESVENHNIAQLTVAGLWLELHPRRVPEYKAEGSMPWLKQIAAGLFLQRPRFNPRPVHVGFVVNKVALGQALVFSGYLCSLMSASFYPCSILIHLLPSYIISPIDSVIK